MLYTPTFFAMAFANLCTLSSFGTFFLFPLFISEHGGSQVDIGIIMGAFALASVVCRPWISEMVDRIGRKRSFTIGLIVMSLVPLVYTLFRGNLSLFYIPLVMVRGLHGVGFAICITAAFTYVADVVPEGRLNEGLGIFGISGLMGCAVGPALAEIILQRYGFHTLFLFASVTAGLGLVFHLPVSESYTGGGRQRENSFFKMFKISRVTLVAALAFLFGFGLAASNNFVSPFANGRQLSFISVYYISYSLSAILTRFVGVRMADQSGEERIIPFALVLTGAGLISLVLVGGNGALVVSGIMGGIGHGFLYPSLNALALRDEPSAIRGKITGVFTGSIDAGAFAGSIILGIIGEFAGFETLFVSAGLALFLGWGVFRMHWANGRVRAG